MNAKYLLRRTEYTGAFTYAGKIDVYEYSKQKFDPIPNIYDSLFFYTGAVKLLIKTYYFKVSNIDH